MFNCIRSVPVKGIETPPVHKNGTSKPNAPKKPQTVSFLFDSCDYICLVCRSRYMNPYNWNRHIKAAHEEMSEWLKQMRCDECRLAFFKPNQFQRHYVSVHDKRTDEEVISTLS